MKTKADKPAVDPAGTTPGLVTPSVPVFKEVPLNCRAGCGGKKAIEIPAYVGSETGGAPANRIYKCVACQATWGVPVGGFFPY